MKASFALIKGLDTGGLQALANRLQKVAFDVNYDTQVLAIDRDFPKMTVELVMRRERETTTFNETENKVVSQKGYEYKTHLFNLDGGAGVLSTPGAKRDFKLFVDLLKRCGAGGAEMSEVFVELVAWTKALLKIYETAQLSQIVIESFYAEPRLIGRYTAKTVDNKLDLKMLEDTAGKLKSIRMSFFSDGVRRSVEARNDGVLAVSSADDDDLAHFFAEQTALLLKHATVPETTSEN